MNEKFYKKIQKEYDRMRKAGEIPIFEFEELIKQIYMSLKVKMVNDVSPYISIDFDCRENQFRKQVEEFLHGLKNLAGKEGLEAIVICHRDLPKEMQEMMIQKSREQKAGDIVGEMVATAMDVKAGLMNRVYVYLKRKP